MTPTSTPASTLADPSAGTIALHTALASAEASVAAAAACSLTVRSGWLEALAHALESRIDDLVAVAMRETHLSETRLRGEVARTANQLRLFAAVVLEGSYLEATLDSADPSATPPRTDLRRMLRPMGVVAVFGASNFPFAFSVLGGDTASALAAGSPVLVKAHPGHPDTSALTASIATEALVNAGAPAGLFSLVHGMEARPGAGGESRGLHRLNTRRQGPVRPRGFPPRSHPLFMANSAA